MAHTTTQTTDKTGVETIECGDCGSLHYVDYDRSTVEPADEADPRATFMDDDGQSFICIDCGARVSA